MQKPDVLRLTFDQNPAVAEALRNLPIAGKAELGVHVTLKARDGEGMDFNIEAVVPEGYELDPDSDAEPTMMGGLSQSDAMMTPLAMMVRKRKGEPLNNRDTQGGAMTGQSLQIK